MHIKHKTDGTYTPYAVVNGKERTITRVAQGAWEVEQGDTLFLCTDGFQPYLEDAGFLDLFRRGDTLNTEHICAYSATKNAENPLRVGHEHIRIAVHV